MSKIIVGNNGLNKWQGSFDTEMLLICLERLESTFSHLKSWVSYVAKADDSGDSFSKDE